MPIDPCLSHAEFGLFVIAPAIVFGVLLLYIFTNWYFRRRDCRVATIMALDRKITSGLPVPKEIAEAEVFLAYGRPKEAIALLERALAEMPGQSDLTIALERARQPRRIGGPTASQMTPIQLGWSLIGFAIFALTLMAGGTWLSIPEEHRLVGLRGALSGDVRYARAAKGREWAEFSLVVDGKKHAMRVSEIWEIDSLDRTALRNLRSGDELHLRIASASCVPYSGYSVWEMSAASAPIFDYRSRVDAEWKMPNRLKPAFWVLLVVGLVALTVGAVQARRPS